MIPNSQQRDTALQPQLDDMNRGGALLRNSVVSVQKWYRPPFLAAAQCKWIRSLTLLLMAPVIPAAAFMSNLAQNELQRDHRG